MTNILEEANIDQLSQESVATSHQEEEMEISAASEEEQASDKGAKPKYQEIIPSKHTLITSPEMLEEVLAQHLNWVNSVLNPKVDVPVGRANLRGSDLRAYSLKGVNLSGADLSECDLRGVDLSAAILTTTNLRGAQLQDANLTHAKLLRAKLDHANLTGTDLTNALLVGCDLESAIIEEPKEVQEADIQTQESEETPKNLDIAPA